jgi:hypothetical protein
MEAQYEGRLSMQQTLAESAQIAVGRGDRGDGPGQPRGQHDSGQSHGGKSLSEVGKMTPSTFDPFGLGGGGGMGCRDKYVTS